jgi:PAS domain S-box-containing protein
VSSPAIPDIRALRTALIVGLAYYLGAKLGFALTLRPSPISTLWLPNSILLSALLLTPVRWWWIILLGALPAHLAVELGSGFPPRLVMGWFVSNCSEALIGAAVVRHLLKGPLRFDRSRDVGVFIFGGAFLATFLSSFLDAGFVTHNGAAPNGFWHLWQTRLFSNVLTSLTLVPVIVSWGTEGFADLRHAPPRRYLEAGLLGAALLAVVILVFNGQKAGLNTSPALLYAPLPFVLWAAVRFGSRGTGTALLLVTALAIWGAVHGHGPFLTRSPAENAVSIQLFLIVFAIPFLVLAAVIQERRHAEALSRDNEERLNLALGAAQVGTWEWRIPEDAVSWSPKSKEILGLGVPDTDITLGHFLDSVIPEDRAQVRLAIQGAIEHGTPYECEFRIIRADGEVRWVLGKGEVLYDDSGRPIRMLGVHVDITERKTSEALRQEESTLRESEAHFREAGHQLEERVVQRTADLSAAIVALRGEISDRVAAERALRSSEERFGKAFHSSPDAIAIVTQNDHRFIEVNEKWEAMFGYSRAEAIGRSSDELNLVVDGERQQRGREELENQGYLHDYELDVRTRSGAILQVLLVTDTMEMSGEPCYIINIRDVTARKRAETEAEEQRQELAHLSRVASLGELSGALAHELNQPLAAILANTRAAQRILMRGSPDLAEVRTILEDIALDDRRAGEVIGRLRALLKKGQARLSEVDLNELVAEVRTLLHSDLIRRRVATETELAPSLPPVLGDRVQLQQVLLNLVANACDAMAGTAAHQRVVTIATSLTAEGWVQLSVRDGGDGIPEERLDQIFDAFFTTKEQGLGLGLAICRSIATAHGGRLSAANHPSGGATFHLVLNPAYPKRRPTQAAAGPAAHSDR